MIVNPMNPKDELYKSLSKWYEEIDKLITLSTHVVHLINVTVFLLSKTIMSSLNKFMLSTGLLKLWLFPKSCWSLFLELSMV